MRFEELFDDLESQLEAELAAEQRDLRAEEERFRLGRLELRDRIAAAPRVLDLELRGGRRLRIRRMALGRDWLNGIVEEGSAPGSGAIIPFTAIVALRLDAGAAAASIEPRERSAEDLVARLSFGFALRDLAKRRTVVQVEGSTGATGTIDRVGRDHFDLAVHEAGTPRRDSAVAHWVVVPFATVDWLRVDD